MRGMLVGGLETKNYGIWDDRENSEILGTTSDRVPIDMQVVKLLAFRDPDPCLCHLEWTQVESHQLTAHNFSIPALASNILFVLQFEGPCDYVADSPLSYANLFMK